jgi:hypothetical protein
MKKFLTYHFVLLFSLALNAQDIVIKVDYPAVVSAGEQFALQWSVNSGGGEFATPPFTGFIKLMGPQTSYNSSTQIINGKMSQETAYTYTYYLQATNAGKYTIAPAQFTYKGKTFYSDSIHIEVISTGSRSQAAQQGGNAVNDDSEPEYAGNDIFVNLGVSRREVYLGEPVAVSVKLYTRVNLSGINEIKFPSFNGFLRADVQTPPLTSLRQENVRGTIYGTGVIQQLLLYPQVTGDLVIDPVQISLLVQKKTGQSDPFFGDFFSSVQTVPRAVASQSVKIRVKPLPGAKPLDYSGIVGQLNMKASINKDTVNVNDPVTFTITVSGTGNLRVAATPALKLSSDIEVYDPKITDDIKNSMSGTSGQKTFEFLLIPRHNGAYTIPPVSYSYFNTSSGRYEKLSTPEFRFHARKGNDQNSGAITVYGGVSKEDVKYLGKDIRFIKSDAGSLSKISGVIINRQTFRIWFLLAIIAFFVVLFLRREHIRRNSDLNQVRNRKAAKVAVKRLHNASVCLKEENIDKFYEEILKALWGYLSDKLNIPVSDLTRINALEALAAQGIEEERLKSLTNILDTCEYARYAPSASGASAPEIYEGASQFIKSVENSLA